MTAARRLVLLAAALLPGLPTVAQVPNFNFYFSGTAQVAPGAVAPRPDYFRVHDAAGNPRSGVTVRFDEHCAARLRGEPAPYACVSAIPGDPLEVVSDSGGNVVPPRYQANNTVGNAWLTATAVVDGTLVSKSFFYRVGSPPLPIQVYSGNNQQTPVSTPLLEPMVVRVVDDRGRPVPGVPVIFNSPCINDFPVVPAVHLPCVRDATPSGSATDGSGFARSTLGPVNNVAGTYTVRAFLGFMTAFAPFTMENYLPRRLATDSQRRLGLRIVDAPATCSIDLFEPELFPPSGKPRMLATPYGIVRVKFGGCPAGATLKLQFLHPGGFPEGPKVWAASPTWQPFETANPVDGTSEFTMVEGGAGDADATAGRIEAFLGMAYGDPESPNFQDLWWTGASGNGWGISITQHGQVIFPIFFVYDAAGEPTWLVMPAGRWNAARDEFSGALYSPRGKPIVSHRAADLVAGTPPGRATLRFRDMMTMEVDLEMPGVSTRISLVRQIHGVPGVGPTTRVGDLWWPGASRSGWGLVLQQQYSTVFTLLFTYRDDGRPTWLVMPSAYWENATTLVGNAFITKSSAWPMDYDPNQLTVQQVGSFTLRFGSSGLTFDVTSVGRSDRFELTRQPF